MMTADPLHGAEPERLAASYELRQLSPSLADQIRPDMDPPFILRRFMGGARSQLDGMLSDLRFRPAGPAGELFDGAAIPIARIEIHPGIDARRIQSKQPLHPAELLEYLPPIQ